MKEVKLPGDNENRSHLICNREEGAKLFYELYKNATYDTRGN